MSNKNLSMELSVNWNDSITLDNILMDVTFYFLKRGYHKVLQAIFQQYQILGWKVRRNLAIGSVSDLPMGLPL